MSGSIKLTLDVSGSVGKATIGPFQSVYELVNESAGTGPLEFKVPPAAGPGDVKATLPPMAVQKLLFMCSDEDVTYELNRDGTQRLLPGGGFVVFPGDPVVSSLTFGNVAGARTATVTLIQIGDEGPAPVSSFPTTDAKESARVASRRTSQGPTTTLAGRRTLANSPTCPM